MFKKIPQKFRDKTVQSNILWLNLNKINKFFLQLAHKQGNPSFHFHAPGSKRRYPCTQTASAVPKYFPCLLQFCTGYRIWHASRVWKRKTFIFTQLKKSRCNQHFFAIFRRILINWPLTYLLWSDLLSPEVAISLSDEMFHCHIGSKMSRFPRRGELRTQKLRSHLLRTQSSKILPLKPGVGQHIATHATLTAGNFILANFYPPGPFTCIFPKTSFERFSGVSCG